MKLNEITIEVTQQCSNHCIYCSSFSDIERGHYLDYEIICNVVDAAKELGAKCVSLSGGEPFLRNDIVNIVEYIHSKGLELRLYSSGIYFTEKYFSSIPLSLLRAIRGLVDRLIINYETVDSELYSTIMGTISSNMNLLDETVRNAVAEGIQVEAHFVPMRCNYSQLPDVLNKLYSMGVVNVSLLRLVPQGRVSENVESILLNDNDQNELKRIITECKENYGRKIRIGLPFCSKRYNCGTATAKLTVRYDGYVFPCEAFKDGMMDVVKDVIPDNVRERSLIDIYENSLYLEGVRSGLKLFEKAKSTETCFGQYCRAQNYNVLI